MHRLIILLLATCTTGICQAQGYFNFDDVPGISSEPTVQVDLNAAMLGFVQAAAAAADPKAAEALAGIENVRLRVYNTIDGNSEFLEFIDDASGALERDGWQRVVYIEESEAKVRVYMRLVDNVASGITVMVAGERDEAVLINVAGEIRPETLGQLMKSVGAGDLLGDVPGVFN